MIEEYIKDFNKYQEEFHEVMHKYPLFEEQIKDLEKHEFKDLDNYIEKFNDDPDDEFYLKKAIDVLKYLIKYTKETSTKINNLYEKFDKLVTKWNDLEINTFDDKELDELNSDINKSNDLIKSHDINDIEKAIEILEKVIYKAKNL